eukprot:g58742.t1
MSGHHHRSSFKVGKKPHKGSTKGSVARKNRGKVERATRSHSVKVEEGGRVKDRRFNEAKQRQRLKREDIMNKKRLGGRGHSAKMVGLLPLSDRVDMGAVCKLVQDACEGGSTWSSSCPAIFSNTAHVAKRNQHYVFYNIPREATVVLDVAKVVDILVLVTCPNEEGDELGDDALAQHCLTILKAQGLPATIATIQGLATLPDKKQHALRKLAGRYFATALGEAGQRILSVDSAEHAVQLHRWLAHLNMREVSWRQHRPYMLAEGWRWQPHDAAAEHSTGTLLVSGFLRAGSTPSSKALSANQLVHLTGYGDFQLSKIERVLDEQPPASAADCSTPWPSTQLLMTSDERRKPLQALVPLDPLAHEQSLISDQELKEARQQRQEARDASTCAVEGGVSAYQSLWNELADEEDKDQQADQPLSEAKEDEVQHMEAHEEEEDEGEDALMATLAKPKADKPYAELGLDQKRKLEQDEVDWPDQVETPRETVLRDRYARYRGLKSFAKSFWDKKESLPLEYSQLCQLEQFQAIYKHIIQTEPGAEQEDEDMDDTKSVSESEEEAEEDLDFRLGPARAGTGRRVVLHIEGVPAACDKHAQQGLPLLVWGLLDHERKVSVLHFQVKRHAEYDLPVKGKEPMLFHVGFRRFLSRPIYTHLPQKGKPDKFLVSRFFQPGRFCVASVYGHITFPPAPVLMFKPAPERKDSVGMGASDIKDCGAGELVASVARYMFYHPDDIRWFKPVMLWTKFGLTGQITEPHGTKVVT